MNPPRQGFSLIEIMAVIGLVVLVLGLTVVQTRGGATGGSAGARGMAQMLAAELKAARQKAIETRSPVAVVLPSAGGTRPHSQSLSVMEGMPHPRVTRVANLAGEFPGAYLAVGQWAGPTATVDSPRVIQAGSLSLAGWMDPPRRDYMLVFDQEGNLLTNDLPWFSGRCHLVACTGLDFTAGGIPAGTPRAGACSPAYFQFTRVYQPFTVSLDPSGTVFLDSGLPEAAAGVSVGGGGGAPSVPPAAPASLVYAPNTAPVIKEIQVLPVGNAGLTGAFNTSVAATGYVTLIVRAADADGDRLSCSWDCSGGNVSHLPGGGQLTWDPRENVWKSIWIWSPPPNALDKDDFVLNCTVSDDRGGAVSASGASGLTLQVRNSGKVAFSGPDMLAGSGLGEIFVCNPDGTGARRLTNNTVDDKHPCLSPDGTKIIFSSLLDGTGRYHVFQMNVDGSGLQQLTVDDGWSHLSPVFNPDGTRIAFANDNNEIFVRDSAGTPGKVADGANPSWSPRVGDNRVAYVRGGDIYIRDTSGGAEIRLTNDGIQDNPSWSLDGNTVMCTESDGDLVAIDVATPLTKTPKGSAQGSLSPLRFSTAPGPPQLVFATAGGIFRADDAGGAAPLFNVQSITPYGCGGVNSPSWGP